MSLELVGTLLTAPASAAIAETIWKVLRQRLQDKGVRDVPGDLSNPNAMEHVAVVLADEEKRFTPAETQSLTIESLTEAERTANGIRAERMRQAKYTFNAALSLAVVGTLIIFGGVLLLIVRESVAAGALTAGIGAVIEVVSAVLFQLNHQTNNRLDEVGKDLGAIEVVRIAVQFIGKIEDPQKRDDAIREAARDLRSYRVPSTP